MASKNLTLIHLECATPLLASIAEPGVTSKLIAIYLASPEELRKFRTEGEVAITDRMNEADEISGVEVAEILEDFFGQHERYQNSILKSAGVPIELLDGMKTEAIKSAMAKIGHPSQETASSLSQPS